MKILILLSLLMFSVFATAQNGKSIGTIKVNSVSEQSINYYIMSGNPSTAFRVDSKTGELFINNQIAIDSYTWYYTLVIRLRYSKNNTIIGDTMRTIRILNMVNNKLIGKFIATDPDNKNKVIQTLNFYFMSGNFSTAFKINGSTGNITINNVNAINTYMINNDKYTLNVRVRDNGVPYKDSFAYATIKLFDNLPKQDVFNCR